MFLLPYALVLLLSGAATIILIRRKSVVTPAGQWITDGTDKADMIDTHDDPSSLSSSSLVRARALQAPDVISTMGGELEHLEFWKSHYQLIQNAWHEWEQEILMQKEDCHKQIENEEQQVSSLDRFLPSLNETIMMEPMLKESIQNLWKKPSVEAELDMKAQYWNEPIPNVYTCSSFFTPRGIRNLRRHLWLMGQSGIPTRRPNGMNRNGFVLDDETEGGVSYEAVDHFRSWLVDDYLRPLGRMFFPEYIGSDADDESSYAFTVHYQYNGDEDDSDGNEPTRNGMAAEDMTTSAADAKNVTTTSGRKKKQDVLLKEHSDASVVTININLNRPEEEYEYDGSSQLLFLDDSTSKRHPLKFQSGMAVIHRGLHRHQALPIQKGSRHQLIIWLFGKDGYVRVAPYEPKEQLSVKKRWSKSKMNKPNRQQTQGDWDPFEL